MELNFFEIAEQYKDGKINYNDEKLKKAQDLMVEMASTEDGREELAELIGMYIDETWNKFDISPYLFQTKNFKLGDRPEFRMKKKGIKAYWIAPNSSTPKTRNYQEVLGMEFDSLSVRPEALMDELSVGRVESLAGLMKDAREAMSNAIVEKVFTLIGQVYNATTNVNQYKADTTSLSADSVKEAIRYVFRKTGVMPTIIGDSTLTDQIMDFDGFTEEIQTQILKTGRLGVYRGATIMSLPEVLDPVTGKSIVPQNRLYVVSKKIGYAGTYGKAKSGQERSIEDWTWNARIDKEYGAVVTDPEGLYTIEVV